MGSGPGRKIATGQPALPGMASSLRAATKPARATEDLPLPEAPTMARKPLTESFATEKECRIIHVEYAQPAIRTLAFVNGLSGTRSRLNTANAADQSMKCIRIIERIAEFDPGRRSQKSGQATALRSFCTRQENRNHAETPSTLADALING